MIFVLSGVNTRPCCCWAVGPGVQLLWPCLWRCCGEAYSAAQGLCCCFRGCIPGLGKPRPTWNMFVHMCVCTVLYPSLSLRILLLKPLVFFLYILCLTSPCSCQHPWMSVYPLFQRQGFTPLHPALLTWYESISVCRAAAAAEDELWECSGGMQELLWCPSGSPCSPDFQKPVPYQLSWPCRTALPGVRRLLHHVPSPKESWNMASEGMDVARAVPLVPVLPTAHLGPAQQIQSGCGRISAIVCAQWSMAEKMKLCL